ncbi:MAG: MerR family transcriptional regulator [Proteobacteria bacterium]|nr:MerR family transcriptional regulator [Pseudomonadota bacterium]
MKISELAKAAEVPKETIHYYVREGLLPKPIKRGRNVADYGDGYVEQIRMIKALQDQFYLPLSAIKRIMVLQRKTDPSSLRELKTTYLQRAGRRRGPVIESESAFMEATGLGPKWLARLEDWGIVHPEIIENEKVYHKDDLTLARLVVEMDRVGLSPRDGHNTESLKYYSDLVGQIAVFAIQDYLQAHLGKLDSETFFKRAEAGGEVVGTFFYHLYRKKAQGEMRRLFESL